MKENLCNSIEKMANGATETAKEIEKETILLG